MTAVEEVGARLNHDFSQRAVSSPRGKILRSFQYTAWLDGADAIIDVCKLKDARHDGHVLRRQEPLRRHPRHLETGISLPLPESGRFCRYARRPCRFRPSPPLDLRRRRRHGGQRPHGGHAAQRRRGAGRAESACPRSRRRPTSSVCERRMCPPSPPPTGAVISPRTRKPFPSPGSCLPSPISIWWRSAVRWNSPVPIPGPLGALAGRAMRRLMRARPALAARECVGCGQCARVCPAPRHPYAREASAHRPAQVHLLLLLSGILSPGGR